MVVGFVPETIAPDEVLHRRLKATQVHHEEGRPTRVAYYSHRDPYRLSVDRAAYRSIEQTLEGHPGFGLAAIEAAAAEEATGAPPEPDPIPAGHPDAPEGNPAHANIVIPDNVTKSKRGKIARRLARASSLIVMPEGRD